MREVVSVFLRLGFTAFGGPAAHTAMMRQELVERRAWVTDEEFVELMAMTNLIPGPNSTELAIHLGYRRAGWAGLWVAGACFILPAAFIVGFLAWIYVQFGALPETQGLLYGMKPVVLAVVGQALFGLVKAVLKGPVPILVAVGAAGLSLLGVSELALVFAPGLVWGLCSSRNWRVWAPLVVVGLAVGAFFGLSWWLEGSAKGVAYGLAPLFFVFLKVGSVLYGSGYVLLSYLNTDLVVRLGWLTKAQLLDAVAVGQFTPGPVFTTATFIGFVLGGVPGAVVATLGIFLPSFFFVSLSSRWLEKARKSEAMQGFLKGVNAAALGLMGAVLVKLGQDALRDWFTVSLALVSLAVLVRFKVNSAWLVAAGAALGFLSTQV
ncbi:MAG: chromate transporter [Armatimonadetes bacterium 55-13]|nr:chromate efflux transporter [Armatimonadota bacterium]OJU61433.1 MAG: chromate transporter [Armatimonadetes bacterium 55-13]